MNKYSVRVTIKSEYTIDLHVEAENEDSARDSAYEEVYQPIDYETLCDHAQAEVDYVELLSDDSDEQDAINVDNARKARELK